MRCYKIHVQIIIQPVFCFCVLKVNQPHAACIYDLYVSMMNKYKIKEINNNKQYISIFYAVAY